MRKYIIELYFSPEWVEFCGVWAVNAMVAVMIAGEILLGRGLAQPINVREVL